jgi:hypothetical protein
MKGREDQEEACFGEEFHLICGLGTANILRIACAECTLLAKINARAGTGSGYSEHRRFMTLPY